MSEHGTARLHVGDLLVATPALLDPNFERTVVLLLDLDEGGALGVVLNRPSGVPVREVLPDWTDVAGEPEVLFQGGPVSTDSALAVGTYSDLGDGATYQDTRLDVRASGSSIDLDRAETAAFEACCNRAIDWKTIKKVSRFRAESAWNRGF